MNFVFLFLVLWLPATLAEVTIYPQDPHSDVLNSGHFTPTAEPYTNLTMDQAIAQSLGGYSTYMLDHFLNTDGTITAELDMRLSLEQADGLYGLSNSSNSPPPPGGRQKRKATRPVRLRWTDGLVPYEFVSSHFSANEIYYMKQAMQDWMDTTCLRFRPANSGDRNRIRLQNGNGCNSALGMVGGTQVINLQAPGCRYKGLYLHEIGHALGLVHEHQLPDRDRYIQILYNNVSPSMRIWFNKYSSAEVNQYGVPYEYSSVMHYGVRAFSIDGRRKTMRALDASREAEIGTVWAKGLSFSDIKVVNVMYRCNSHCQSDATCREPGYLNKNCQCVCPPNVQCKTGTRPTTIATPPTVTGPTEPGSCQNSYHDSSQCRAWASTGECDVNPIWMRANCEKDCNSCPTTATATSEPATTPTTPTTPTTTPTTTPPTTPTTTTTATTMTTTTGRPCVNTYNENSCVYWARIGECARNEVWMTSNCRKSCRACGGGGGSSCQDNNQYCSYWSRFNYCGTTPYMNTNCKRSCGLCSGSNTSSGGGGATSNCINRNNSCGYWSRAGYCDNASFRTYMRANCRAACRLC